MFYYGEFTNLIPPQIIVLFQLQRRSCAPSRLLKRKNDEDKENSSVPSSVNLKVKIYTLLCGEGNHLQKRPAVVGIFTRLPLTTSTYKPCQSNSSPDEVDSAQSTSSHVSSIYPGIRKVGRYLMFNF